MNNLTISLSETIPFLDVNGVVMQMKNFEFTVSGTQEEGQTPKQIQQEVREEFEKVRDYCSTLQPAMKKKQEKFNKILLEFKKETPELYNTIISKYK